MEKVFKDALAVQYEKSENQKKINQIEKKILS